MNCTIKFLVAIFFGLLIGAGAAAQSAVVKNKSLPAFMRELKAAVAVNDSVRVTDMTFFPFGTKYGEVTKQEFLENYDTIISAQIKEKSIERNF
jgi:hypothetical protein